MRYMAPRAKAASRVTSKVRVFGGRLTPQTQACKTKTVVVFPMPRTTWSASGADEQTLHSLPGTRPLYCLPTNLLSEEVLVPCFRGAQRVDCMVGFFSSAALAAVQRGYKVVYREAHRLIVEPHDARALRLAHRQRHSGKQAAGRGVGRIIRRGRLAKGMFNLPVMRSRLRYAEETHV